ncbi:hypothetical protein AX16_000596 [Volvariella volvacea WC 439]|nr:hypothetical protein AX16_000596 [Volvariella volvacea WC 439]
MIKINLFLTLSCLTLAAYAFPLTLSRRQSTPGIPASPGEPEPFILPPIPFEPPGPSFDSTATRAVTRAQIKNLANPNICFDVSDFRSGDFRFNLVPIALRPCNASFEGQRFDLITRGEHNLVENTNRTIIVSSQQLTCVDRESNISDRTRPGLMACGGRAAGDGETSFDQQYFFDHSLTIDDLRRGIGFTQVRDAPNGGIGDGNICLTFDQDGFLNNKPCSPPNFSPEQIWIVEEVAEGEGQSSASSSDVPATSSTSSTLTPSSVTPTSTSTSTSTTSTTGTSVVATPTASPSPSPIPTSSSTPRLIPNCRHSHTVRSQPKPTRAAGGGEAELPEPFILPPPGRDGPGPTFDATATRAATNASIRSVANPELCFDVSDFRAGDFRFNLVPIALRRCDRTREGQRFDLITKGEHNNVEDGSRTIIVSSQQLTCIDRIANINDRTRPGLFACGGRAAGDGETSFDQQYFFNSSSTPDDLKHGIGFAQIRDAANDGVGEGNVCLTLNEDGFLDSKPCAPPEFLAEQLWIVE